MLSPWLQALLAQATAMEDIIKHEKQEEKARIKLEKLQLPTPYSGGRA